MDGIEAGRLVLLALVELDVDVIAEIDKGEGGAGVCIYECVVASV
jgi:hypothetical protein